MNTTLLKATLASYFSVSYIGQYEAQDRVGWDALKAMCVEKFAAFLESFRQDFKNSNMAAMLKFSFHLSLGF